MKKTTPPAFILTIQFLIAATYMIACSPGPKKPSEMGSLKGNVFWKYNNYVGNKPDAGASITLYSLSDTAYSETATCDVQGNYSIDSIPEGYYFAVIASKATTESPSSALENIYLDGSFLKTIARDSLRGLKQSWDSVTSLNGSMEKLEKLSSPYQRLRKRHEIEDSINHIANRWFEARSLTALNRLGKILPSAPKVKYQIITIKPRRIETLITDFGITYY